MLTQSLAEWDADPLEPVEPSPETIVTWWLESVPAGRMRSFRFPYGWTEETAKAVAAEMLARQESFLFKGWRPEWLRVIERVVEDI